MKILLSLLIFTCLITNANAKDITKIHTSDLIPIVEKHGIDSTLYETANFPIYLIDNITALELLEFVENYEPWSPSKYFFSRMAHNWEHRAIKEKTKELLIKQVKKIDTTSPGKYGNIHILDHAFINCLIYQQPNSINHHFIHAYENYVRKADSLENEYPSWIVRLYYDIFLFSHPVVREYEDYHENCSRIMLVLGELKSSYYDSLKLDYHYSKLSENQKDADLFWYKESDCKIDDFNTKRSIKTIELSKEYNSLDEVDLQNEAKLKYLKHGGFGPYNRTLLIHNNMGCLELSQNSRPSQGKMLKIELVEKNKLLINLLYSW